MIYEVVQGGRAVAIQLKEVGEGLYDVSIDGGEVIRVDAVKSGRTIYSLIEKGKQFEVMVDSRGQHKLDVQIAGQLFHFDVYDERSKLYAQQAKIAAHGKQEVEAAMPGKVVKLNVAVGDLVTEGASLLVLEAMKMENDIPSPIAGKVTAVNTSVGSSVEAGAKLVVVEPVEASA